MILAFFKDYCGYNSKHYCFGPFSISIDLLRPCQIYLWKMTRYRDFTALGYCYKPCSFLMSHHGLGQQNLFYYQIWSFIKMHFFISIYCCQILIGKFTDLSLHYHIYFLWYTPSCLRKEMLIFQIYLVHLNLDLSWDHFISKQWSYRICSLVKLLSSCFSQKFVLFKSLMQIYRCNFKNCSWMYLYYSSIFSCNCLYFHWSEEHFYVTFKYYSQSNFYIRISHFPLCY